MRFPAARRISLNCLLATASIAVVAGLAEVVLRRAGHLVLQEGESVTAGRIFRLDDPQLGFSLVPGSSRIIARGGAYLVHDRINSLGLRDIEHSIERRPGLRRILVLGDSFMFGDGVPMERTMPRRLAERMPDVEVINAGVRAWDLGQEYLYYRHHGHRFRPDLVLLAFFINDLTPERGFEVTHDAEGLPISYRRHADRERRDRETAPRGVSGAVSIWLRDHSMLYSFVRARLDRASLRRRAAAAPAKDHAADTPYLHAFHAAPEGSAQESWRRACRVLDELRHLSAQAGAGLAVVLIPAPWQLSEREWDRWVEWLGVEPASLSRRKPQEMIRSWCSRSATPCLDLLDEFEEGDREQLYFPHDHHWSEDGHEAAADLVARFLENQGLP